VQEKLIRVQEELVVNLLAQVGHIAVRKLGWMGFWTIILRLETKN